MWVAEVRIWDRVAGAVAWDAVAAHAVFEYDPNFVRSGWDLAPLQMPLGSGGRLYRFPGLGSESFRGLPGLLADALPDRYGNRLIEAWLARQGRPAGSMNPVEALCFIGTRGMGALEFAPVLIGESQRTFSVELDDIVQVAAQLLQRRNTFAANLEREREKSISEILKIGTSAGGARPKALIAWNPKTGEVRSGQTRTPIGFEHWLIKLDGVRDPQSGITHGYGRVEMAYHLMARACGIAMMPCRLHMENGRAHFMTQRFDREGPATKHHVQTLCALKHFDFNDVHSYSYEQLFQCMREIHLDYSDAEQMFRRMVFNVVARNCDDHTKNFAFMLRKGGAWELAPAYDICHAYRPDSPWVSRQSLSVGGKRQDITRQDLLAIGRSIRCKNAPHIIEQIVDTVRQWPRFAMEVDVAPRLRKAVQETLLW